MGLLWFFLKKEVDSVEHILSDNKLEDKLANIVVDDDTNVTIKQDVECEIKENKKELLSKSYHRKYVFCGQCDRIIEVNGQSVKYSHIDYFLADDWWPSTIKKVIKLTGDNLDGKPIPITGEFRFTPGNKSYYNPQFVYNGQKYSLSQDSIDSNNLENHYITGQELADRVTILNLQNINWELKKQEEKQELDAMFN